MPANFKLSTMEVAESQRLIAVSIGKIAASRSQRGGINLHKNLLVATVLHKARTVYMIEQLHVANKQRSQQQFQHQPVSVTQPTTTTPAVLETREQNKDFVAPISPAAPHSFGVACHEASRAESGSPSEQADVSRVQVPEFDKENTPPVSLVSSTSPLFPSNSLSTDCEMRLHQENLIVEGKELRESNGGLSAPSVTHTQQTGSTHDYVSKCSSCVLKRRRTTDRDSENFVAPKVRILESPSPSSTNTELSCEPMQPESPQISNLVNIFNTGFSGLCATMAAANDSSARGLVLPPVLSSHKLSSDSKMMCGKEMKTCMDSVPHAIALTV